MKRFELNKIKWKPYSDDPIITPPWGSPILADPTVLVPEETPDGKWHLFAHTIWGIHHFRSDDGIKWGKSKLLFRNAMRAHIFHDDGVYYLLYEKYRPLQIMFPWMRFWKWKSRIMMRASKDLKSWSGADVMLRPELLWQRDVRYGESVSNPCLARSEKGYLLYFSANLSFVPDCGFCEPKHIGVAESRRPNGPYRVHPEPIISSEPEGRWDNIGAGSIKVKRMDDGFVGFQNGIYSDKRNGKSGSAIMMLQSFNGRDWQRMKDEPIVRPTSGWQQSHVYACDVKYVPSQNKFYLYYNARDDWHWTKGKERIGLVIGTP
ncbi:MAG: glycosyl hydrolase family 43 [Spirochaetes bacterium]|nr:glycosyl hydrolase family 43 [Spirochaetota bacterium]